MTVSVLVVEDDPDVREIVAFQVGLLGHAAREAGTLAQAIGMLGEASPDVVLTDIHLGEEDCAPLVAACQATGVPVVVMTAADEAEAVMSRAVRGACALLHKPVALDALGRALTEAAPGIEGTDAEGADGA